MKIAIVISNLNQGGIATAFSSLLHTISENNSIEITAFILGARNTSRLSLPSNLVTIHPSRMLNYWCSGSLGLKGLSLFLHKAIHYIGNRISYWPWTLSTKYGNSYGDYDIAISYENDIANPMINFMCNDFVLNRINAAQKFSWIHNDPYRLGFTHDYCTKRYKEFDGVVSVSKANKDKFDQICPEYKKKSFLVYNCINLDEFKKEKVKKWSSKDGKLHIISVSRLANEQKRIDRMIDTTDILKKNGFGECFVWHMFGTGPDEKKLKEYAKQKKVENCFVFEGFTKQPLTEMAMADIYVMTSDYEGFGLTILEALSQKIPVVVTDFAEAHESIKNGLNGVITSFEPSEIAEKIIHFIKNKSEIKTIQNYIQNNPITNDLAIKQFYSLIGLR